MEKKVSSIMLIDDDDITNFINRKVIERTKCAESIVAVTSAMEALKNLAADPAPGLIFLDINMPAMNGWDFIEEYRKINQESPDRRVIVMLTSSANPDDYARAQSLPEVSICIGKPLTDAAVLEIIKKYF